MIVDFHTHIYPDKIASKGVQYVGDFYGFHLTTLGTDAHLRQCCKQAGVDKRVLLAVSIRPDQVDSINAWLRDRLDADTFGFAALHPFMEDPLSRLEQFPAMGFAGVKFHPDMQQFNIDDRHMDPVYAWLQAHRFPVCFHMGDPRYDYSRPIRLARVLDRFPELRVVAAHLGGYERWDEAASCLSDSGVYYDTSSAIAFMTPERAAEIILRHGADKVLFGTDYPVTTQREELALFMRVPLCEAHRQAILSGNACRFLGIAPPPEASSATEPADA